MKAWTRDNCLYVMIGLRCFGIQPTKADDMLEWIHEFTESSISELLFGLRESNSFCSIITPNRIITGFTLSHIISSLVTMTHVDTYGIITTLYPDEFWRLCKKED